MKNSSLFCLALLWSIFCSFSYGATTRTHKRCYTHYRREFVTVVPTHTKTIYTTYDVTLIKHKHVRSTVAPPAVSTTVTSLSTKVKTKHVKAGTITSTSISQATTTITLSAVTSVTFAIETSTSTEFITTTIAPGYGFEPIQSSLPGAGFDGFGSSGGSGIFGEDVGERGRDDAVDFSPGPGIDLHKGQPYKVFCRKFIETPHTVTVQKTGTKTVTGPTTTSTATLHQTVTRTKKVGGHKASTVLTTITDTQTAVIYPFTVTSTLTTTDIETVQSPIATSYSLCSAENYADEVGGNAIYNSHTLDGSPSPYAYVATNDTTVQDCCISCAMNPDCVLGGFTDPDGPSFDPSDVPCYVGIAESGYTCTQPYQYPVGVLSGDPGPPYDFAYFNGYCGSVVRLDNP